MADTEFKASDERWARESLRTLYVINGMLKRVEADGLHIEVILPRVLDVAVKQLNAQDGSIIVVNKDLEIEHVWLTGNRTDVFLDGVMKGGVAGDVIRNKRPAVIQDTRNDARWLPGPNETEESQPLSVLCTPFIVRDRSIGAITIHKRGTNQFNERDLNLLTTISSQASSTIENARIYEQSQRQLKEMALLNQASRVINESLDINQIMQSLLAQMNELLHAEALSIALVDKQTNELVFRVAEGVGSDKIVNLRLPANSGLSGWVMQHAEPALVADTSQDTRFYRGADERTGHHTRAMICAPIQFKEEVLGTIQAINPINGTFAQEDLNLLVNLANIASSAIANAQQFARIQEAEVRYMTLFQSSVDPIILTDASGMIVEVNAKSVELFGYEREEFLKMAIQELHPSFSPLPEPYLIQRDRPEVFNSQIITKDEKNVHVEVHVKRTFYGDSELLQWIHHDISKQIELEEMREDLTAMLFHDLQSPLSNVIASLDLLTEEIPPNSDPSFSIMLDIAMRSSRRLQTLIKSLLDINQLEAGHPVSDQDIVSVPSLLDEVREMAMPRLDKYNIELVSEFEPDLPEIFAEEDMIRRVLVNLVDNSLKYSQSDQDIVISAAVCPDDANKVLISVTDKGVGIPKRYHKTIFEKFERVAKDSTSKGLGLGLAFCRLAIEAHGGRIWVEDGPEGGARFSFTVPAAPEEMLL